MADRFTPWWRLWWWWFIGSIGKSCRVHSLELLKFFRAPIHSAYRTVIFAIARLSCCQIGPIHCSLQTKTNKKSCCGRENDAVIISYKIRYISKFTGASRHSPCNSSSTPFLFYCIFVFFLCFYFSFMCIVTLLWLSLVLLRQLDLIWSKVKNVNVVHVNDFSSTETRMLCSGMESIEGNDVLAKAKRPATEGLKLNPWDIMTYKPPRPFGPWRLDLVQIFSGKKSYAMMTIQPVMIRPCKWKACSTCSLWTRSL